MNSDIVHRASGLPEFYAELRPNRSLSQVGFIVLLAGFSVISIIIATIFMMSGAWPVSGFFRLDIVGVAAAFWICRRRSADVTETVDLRPDVLTVVRTQRKTGRRVWIFQPYWLRVELEMSGEIVGPLWLYSHGRGLKIAEFLGARDRREFAVALRHALARVQA